MCKHSAFEGASNSNCNVQVGYSVFKKLPNSNCETREVVGDASLLSLNFCVSSFVFPTFSIFKLVYHE